MWHFPDARNAAQSKNLGLAIESAPMRSRNFGWQGSIGQSDDRDRNLAAGWRASPEGNPVHRDDPVDLWNLTDEITIDRHDTSAHRGFPAIDPLDRPDRSIRTPAGI